MPQFQLVHNNSSFFSFFFFCLSWCLELVLLPTRAGLTFPSSSWWCFLPLVPFPCQWRPLPATSPDISSSSSSSWRLRRLPSIYRLIWSIHPHAEERCSEGCKQITEKLVPRRGMILTCASDFRQVIKAMSSFDLPETLNEIYSVEKYHSIVFWCKALWVRVRNNPANTTDFFDLSDTGVSYTQWDILLSRAFIMESAVLFVKKINI